MQNETKPDQNAAADKEFRSIPVVEETIRLQKQIVDAGGIRVIKKVDDEPVDVPLVSRIHGYSIERSPMNKYVDHPPSAVRYEGNTMVISVVEEELVTVKRIKIIEEVRITPVESERLESTTVNLKKERITIVKDPP